MLSRKAHLDSGEFSFTDQKKTTHFLSLVKKKHHPFTVCCCCCLWAIACKEGHGCTPARSSFTGNVFLSENDQSINPLKEVYLMWSQKQKGSGTETNKIRWVTIAAEQQRQTHSIRDWPTKTPAQPTGQKISMAERRAPPTPGGSTSKQ